MWPDKKEEKEEFVEKDEDNETHDDDTNTNLSFKSEDKTVDEEIAQKTNVEEVYAEPLIGTIWKQVRDFGTQVSSLALNKNKQHNLKSESYTSRPSILIPPSHGGTFHVSKDAVPLSAPSDCLCRRY